MAHISADRVKETTTTTGTGNVTLAGAVTQFRTFASVMANNDTCWYCIAGQTGSEWETGLGTYVSATPALARTTVLASSNAGSAVNFSAGTKDVFITMVAAKSPQLNNEGAVILPNANAATFSTPAADTMGIFARKLSGRMLPKIIGPSGLDTPLQPALFGNKVVMYMPNTGTTVGLNLGTPWAAGGTVSHPTPATTAPAVANQMKRTRLANVATTTNQTLGISSIVTGAHQFWRGNAAGLGGFFFFTRFIVELYPATTVRIFAGLQSGTTNILASNTVAGDVVGLWHDTADGANVLSLVTRDNTTTTKTSITGATVAAGQAFDFYMFCAPNGSEIFYRLDSINSGTTIVDSSTTTTLPRNTIFMGPVVGMSNGTANTTVTTVAPGINRIYVESDR